MGLSDKIGSLEPGKKADIVLIKNDDSPAMFPILNPYGHVAFQAQRGDVHTVVVDGRVVKRDGRVEGLPAARAAVGQTVDYLMGELGDSWISGMNPDIPETKILDNPYTYTDYRSS